jgi:hypothetical protein
VNITCLVHSPCVRSNHNEKAINHENDDIVSLGSNQPNRQKSIDAFQQSHGGLKEIGLRGVKSPKDPPH